MPECTRTPEHRLAGDSATVQATGQIIGAIGTKEISGHLDGCIEFLDDTLQILDHLFKPSPPMVPLTREEATQLMGRGERHTVDVVGYETLGGEESVKPLRLSKSWQSSSTFMTIASNRRHHAHLAETPAWQSKPSRRRRLSVCDVLSTSGPMKTTPMRMYDNVHISPAHSIDNSFSVSQRNTMSTTNSASQMTSAEDRLQGISMFHPEAWADPQRSFLHQNCVSHMEEAYRAHLATRGLKRRRRGQFKTPTEEIQAIERDEKDGVPGSSGSGIERLRRRLSGATGVMMRASRPDRSTSPRIRERTEMGALPISISSSSSQKRVKLVRRRRPKYEHPNSTISVPVAPSRTPPPRPNNHRNPVRMEKLDPWDIDTHHPRPRRSQSVPLDMPEISTDENAGAKGPQQKPNSPKPRLGKDRGTRRRGKSFVWPLGGRNHENDQGDHKRSDTTYQDTLTIPLSDDSMTKETKLSSTSCEAHGIASRFSRWMSRLWTTPSPSPMTVSATNTISSTTSIHLEEHVKEEEVLDKTCRPKEKSEENGFRIPLPPMPSSLPRLTQEELEDLSDTFIQAKSGIQHSDDADGLTTMATVSSEIVGEEYNSYRSRSGSGSCSGDVGFSSHIDMDMFDTDVNTEDEGFILRVDPRDDMGTRNRLASGSSSGSSARESGSVFSHELESMAIEETPSDTALSPNGTWKEMKSTSYSYHMRQPTHHRSATTPRCKSDGCERVPPEPDIYVTKATPPPNMGDPEHTGGRTKTHLIYPMQSRRPLSEGTIECMNYSSSYPTTTKNERREPRAGVGDLKTGNTT